MTLHSTSVFITVNGGSSSIKVSLAADCATSLNTPTRLFSATLDRIDAAPPQHATLTIHATAATPERAQAVPNSTFDAALAAIIGTLKDRIGAAPISGIGHRIVHGGVSLLEHQRITPAVLAALKAAQPFDLDHLPREIALIEGFATAFPNTAQVACFDTAFHRDMPRVAQLLPIPRRYFRAGLRHFGFHGLSYTSLMRQLADTAGTRVSNGRVILAHLGAGTSMAAVRGGKPIDTTMSFTPLSGLVMATRPGDLDPGLLCFLLRTLEEAAVAPRAATPTPQHLAARLNHMLSTECGLLGLSELSGDMRNLFAAKDTNPQAAEAIDLFCYTARKHLCALAGAMGGVETIVFSGGIGEHSSQVRAAICDGLEFLGVTLDSIRNAEGRGMISPADAPAAVYVLPTDEEAVIVQVVRALVGTNATAEPAAASLPHSERHSARALHPTVSPTTPSHARTHTRWLQSTPDHHLHPQTIAEAKDAWRNEGNPN